MGDFSLLSLALLAAALLATGVVAGLTAGLLGVGGGIVIVPVLYYMFTALGIEQAVLMHLAVGTSLATIVATGTSSALAHHRRGSVDMALLKRWWLPIAAGVLAGATLAGNLSGGALTLVFGVVALAVAANMLLRREGSALAERLPGTPLREALGFFIGSVSVMMGIGGGTLGVPILTLFSYPIRMAVGTAAAIGLIIAVPGTLMSVWYGLDVPNRPPLSLGYVNLVGFFLIIPASVYAAPLGARIAHAIPPARLRLVFALFLGFTGARMIYGVLT
ncbi:sulfite exporter TauE/SafE family protein [Polymorphum gilvum]|uniref:Probable membrane transporter protein n=1 Tax=Polymorphum gilvum (strain LMG 25793 / CGMCC 1.9160 / SL003B-26A1) TaxID=991905 RepID=F2J0Y3_POLGS|nr:sulfite exporter TauE/SafE family protein [Polymorphum gilvum]ADZ71929.1 Conserved domain protein, putative [Polymorphum gilvum SL003B-26A1]